MKVNDYSFGEIVVDGKTYQSDLILFPEKMQTGWKRCQGHSLILEDIEDIISYHPDVLVIGTGASGVLKVSLQTIEAIEKLNIKVIAKPTAMACAIFNEYMDKNEKVVGAFHLTC